MDDPPAQPPKRGRGRPRKPRPAEPVPKRPRGRPRKQPAPPDAPEPGSAAAALAELQALRAREIRAATLAEIEALEGSLSAMMEQAEKNFRAELETLRRAVESAASPDDPARTAALEKVARRLARFRSSGASDDSGLDALAVLANKLGKAARKLG